MADLFSFDDVQVGPPALNVGPKDLFDFGPEDVREANLAIKKKVQNEGFVTYPELSKEQVEGKDLQGPRKPAFAPVGLEMGEPIPFTPTFRLVDMIGSAALKGLRNVKNAATEIVTTRGMGQSEIDLIKGSDGPRLDQISASIKGSESNLYGDELMGQDPLSSVSNNFFDRRSFFSSRVPGIQAEIRERTEQLIPGAPELQKEISAAVQTAHTKAQQKVKAAYDKVEAAGDNTKEYSVGPMRENILIKLREKGVPEAVIRNIKRNLFYTERNLVASEKGALKMLPELDEAAEIAATKLRTQLPNYKDTRKDMYKAAEIELHGLKQSGASTAKINKLQSAMDKYISTKSAVKDTEAILPEFDKLKEKDFIRLIREINRKKFVGGGDMGKYDEAEQQGLTYAKKMVEDYFEAATAKHNPEISGLFKDARKAYAQKVTRFGKGNRGSENLPELGKMVKKPFAEAEEVNTSQQIDNLLRSPVKIKEIGKILDEDTPGSGAKLAEEWLYSQLGTIKQGSRNVIDLKKADLTSLSTQLDNIVSNKRTMKFITETLGPKKAEELNSMFNVVSSLNSITKDITKAGDGQVTKGAFEYIGAGSNLPSQMARSVHMIKDLLTRTGGQGKYSREVMDRAVKLIERVKKSRTAMEQSQARQELKSWTEQLLESHVTSRGSSLPAAGSGMTGTTEDIDETTKHRPEPNTIVKGFKDAVDYIKDGDFLNFGGKE